MTETELCERRWEACRFCCKGHEVREGDRGLCEICLEIELDNEREQEERRYIACYLWHL